MTLYELTDDMLKLLNMLEQLPEEGDEESELQEQAIRDTMEAVAGDFTEKAEGYGKVLRQLLAEIEAVKAEKMRLAKVQNNLERNADRLKDAMKHAMMMLHLKKLKTDLFTFSTRAGQELVIDAENIFEIPDDFLRYKDPEPDKTAIKKYLKFNEAPWAHMEETQSLIIK